MSLHPAIAALQTATRALHDDAVWVSATGSQALTGIYESAVGSPLDARAEPVVPTFRIIWSDAPGLVAGDELEIGAERFRITKTIVDRLMDEATLELRRLAP